MNLGVRDALRYCVGAGIVAVVTARAPLTWTVAGLSAVALAVAALARARERRRILLVAWTLSSLAVILLAVEIARR